MLSGNLSTNENTEENLENLINSIMCRTDFRLESIEYYREVLNALKITKKLDQTTLSQFKKILEQGFISFEDFNLKSNKLNLSQYY